MKRHLFVPSADRFVSVEDGTVRDLDGNELGQVFAPNVGHRWWEWMTPDGAAFGATGTQAAALAALLADPSCPTPGPNRYDR